MHSAAFDDRIRREISDLRLETSVRFLGRQVHEWVRTHLREFDVGVSVLYDDPNYRTSVPTKVLEYNLAGLPAIVADLPVSRTIVHDGRTGLIVPPASPAGLADAIRSLAGDPQALRRMGEAARENVRTHFSWESEYERLESVYQAVAAPVHT